MVFNFCRNLDYAHIGQAFVTWHRHFNIWFEYEVQWMLQRMGRPDYHTYRSPYFDWRREIQEGSGVKFEDLLVKNRFGFTNYSSHRISCSVRTINWRLVVSVCINASLNLQSQHTNWVHTMLPCIRSLS